MPTATAEIVALRDRYRKVFDTDEPGVRIARISAGPAHIRRSGAWVDRSLLVQAVAGGWTAETDDALVGVVNGWLTFTYQGRSLQMRPTAIGMVDRTDPENRWQKLADASYANVSRSGNTITVSNIFPQTDLTLRLADGQLTKAFTVRQRVNVPDPTSLGWDPSKTFIVIVWDVQKPAGAVVRDTVTDEVVGPGYVGNNDLAVETPTGDPVVRFKRGEAVSATGHRRPVWYVVQGSKVPFGEAYAYDRWALATFPLVIDPTTTVETAASADDGTATWMSGPTNNSWHSDYADLTSYAYQYEDYDKGWYYAEQRPVMRFDLSGITGTCSIANLRFYVLSGSASSHDVRLVTTSAQYTDAEANSTVVGTCSLAYLAPNTYTVVSVNASAVEAKFGGYAAFRLQLTTYFESPLWAIEAFDKAESNEPQLEVTYSSGGGAAARSQIVMVG